MLVTEKLKENAITSIRHGIEDFQRSKGEDPFRAISSARNLFAGVLLLFKYRLILSIKDQQEMNNVIYKPPKDITPHPDGKGGIQWKPVGKFLKTTIDVEDIKKRFIAFNIKVDWKVMGRLQEERNHIEHLHPTQSVGAIAGFIADLFPVLSKFIEDELDEVPATLLGEAWPIMLAHHDFFVQSQQKCIELWSQSNIPNKIKIFIDNIVCDGCGSPLTQPDEDSHEHYKCMACGNHYEIFDQLEFLLEASLGGYDPSDGDEPPVDICPECDHTMFAVTEGQCYWCEYELEDSNCYWCEEALGLDEQHTGGLCSYHYYLSEKDD